jgi:hypothetical protein
VTASVAKTAAAAVAAGDTAAVARVDNLRTYAAFAAPMRSLRSHQTLALRRGAATGTLTLKLQVPEAALAAAVERAAKLPSSAQAAYDSAAQAQVRTAVEDGVKRLLRPALERTAWRETNAAADESATAEFAVNLRALLMQRPLHNTIVLGLDPGFTSGCKLAVCSGVGAVLATATLYPFGKRGKGGDKANGEAEAKEQLRSLITQHKVRVSPTKHARIVTARRRREVAAGIEGSERSEGANKSNRCFDGAYDGAASKHTDNSRRGGRETDGGRVTPPGGGDRYRQRYSEPRDGAASGRCAGRVEAQRRMQVRCGE